MRMGRHLVPRVRAVLAVLVLVLTAAGGLRAQSARSEYERLGREVLRELIETDTTVERGSATVAARKLAARFLAAGFSPADVLVVEAAERKGNLVVRFRAAAAARRPVLFLAHLDVVEARREDWSFDPWTLLERDGYLYGRGTLDVKGGAATLVAALLRLRLEGFAPDRDLILALTADEEGGTDNGVRWLLANRRDLIEAAYCVNLDAGGGELAGGKLVALDVQASEKVYISFTLTARGPGGHSSLPVADNVIYRLAAGLRRLAAFEFPARLNEITRAYFRRMAVLGTGPGSADLRAIARPAPDASAVARVSRRSAFHNALLRSTCVATLVHAGHAENALPQSAQATVNCRLLPDEDAGAVRATIERVLADPGIVVAPVNPPIASPPSPLAPEVFSALERVAQSIWGAVPIVPTMETGATDGLYLRNAGIPVYGVTGIAYDVDDVRAHGRDERILVRSFHEGLDFSYRLMKALTGVNEPEPAARAPR